MPPARYARWGQGGATAGAAYAGSVGDNKIRLIQLDDAPETGVISGLGQPHGDIRFVNQSLSHANLQIGVSRIRQRHSNVPRNLNLSK